MACWWLFGPHVARVEVSAVDAPKQLPRYWSVSGKGDGEGVTEWVKPEGLKVVGLVFYGRPASVSILDCYLKRNLVENGGVLDEVIFIVRTKKMQDLGWLDALLETSDSYRKQNVTWEGKDYRGAYDIIQNGTMYIKIDDDIVFFEDTTIPTLVSTRLNHPEYFVVSANIMNQPSLSWLHWRLGAVRPYLPELAPPPNATNMTPNSTVSWHASELPKWDGPEDFNYTEYFDSGKLRRGHRWLPVSPNSSVTIDETPIVETKYDAFGLGLWYWSIAAQEHYSFFENLEKNELFRYKFHRWDYNYGRMGIQFIAMMGDDINRGKPMEQQDDEYYFSEVMPKWTRRHAIVDGRALAAHYSFEPQRDGMASTDVLDRYRAFAEENICVQE
ncbi:hypothetical protein EJ06DRAFT_472081 [Trichodelitschia bisporula]|uniref:Nucleotide-diphospho-sugar transferase n=1 Tax=Trichodelitschia bisporula TaxID=703511 RepID=A0A6G1I415_9PEZI|nr:hypothetical protein EJ06DRAFT_472081 [Trichodelitschia bisporula]